MAIDKVVDSTQLDADLTSVANAIRTKGGTSGSLAFPAGFVSAVQAIPTGGGGVRKLTLVSENTNTKVPVIRGIWDTELDEIVVDCNHLNVFPAPNYCAVSGKPKLTYQNAENAKTIIDFCRQGVTFAEVDFGGCAPETIKRFFYQGNYTSQIDGESAIPSVVYAYNLDLSNVTVWDTVVWDPGTTINLIFSGTLSVASASYSDVHVTVDSIVSLLNCLADVTESGTTHTITLGNNKARLSAEQLAIATEKGWTVA